MKLPFCRALRNAFPESRITWVAGQGKSVYADRLKPLVAGLIDEVIEEVGIGGRRSEAATRRLGGRRFDLILDTQRRIAVTLAVRRIPHRRFLSGCARYLLSDPRPPGVLRPAYRKPPAMIDQMLELVSLARHGRTDGPLDTGGAVTLSGPVRAEAARLLPEGYTYVALAPGAGGRSKYWPQDRFVELGNRLLARNLVPVYVLGPSETQWLRPLREVLPAARFPLSEPGAALDTEPLLSIALAARCIVCVANDSGVGHIFAASGAPLVSLFGPTLLAKFAARAQRLTVIEAANFGSREMSAIPVQAVASAVEALARN